MIPQIGQIYRDTYFDGKRQECTKRTVRIVEIIGDKVRAETITDVKGGQHRVGGDRQGSVIISLRRLDVCR